ncbi:unnamed protein product [Cuscuta campestris]|uniref:Uncharacterized protein n=2 Tax=Cuscuta sect. Cleistogrammica TaxID=1824901 RepID=A0A484L5T7_9ASTE|nr:hypothetical protein DM860_010608 [Cuscuta australis]VFQ71705.1 unnamed protein product [Cuscuta campestris]
MDPRYAGETLKHLEKQYDLLMEAHSSLSDELHTLKVEEEMLMLKFYEVMAAHGLTKRGATSKGGDLDNPQKSEQRSLVLATNNEQ